MRTNGKLAALTGALVSLASGRPARADAVAQGATTLRVALVLEGDCAHDAAATEKIFGIELDARVVASAPDVTTAKVRCDGASAVVVVVDPVTGKTVERRVDLSSFSESKGRARAVAIAAAELVSASWAEAALPPPRVPPAAAPAPPEERAVVATRAASRTPETPQPTPARVDTARTSLAALGAVRAFPDVALFGGALRYETTAGRVGAASFALAVDVGAAHGRATTSLGSVDADVIDGAGALTVRVPLAGPFALRGGAGLRVGHAALRGHEGATPAETGVVQGFATAPHALAGVRVGVGSWFFVDVGAELGAFVNGPRGAAVARDATSTVALRGGYLTGALGAGATF